MPMSEWSKMSNFRSALDIAQASILSVTVALFDNTTNLVSTQVLILFDKILEKARGSLGWITESPSLEEGVQSKINDCSKWITNGRTNSKECINLLSVTLFLKPPVKSTLLIEDH
ncbi:hypothetical protein J6590_092506 [Homalodisca vitripennis]|nr:hypothetical protein J6590_092506 [Homalodisca vitripennis]